jgi:Family of unknown function (DUF5681)
MPAAKKDSTNKRNAGDHTPKQHRNLKEPWKPGQSGNSKGRPKGARNRLGTAFLEALEADFNEHGVEAIEKVRENKPDVYIKIVADLLPKEASLTVDHGEAFTKIWHAISDGYGEEIIKALDAANDDEDTLH